MEVTIANHRGTSFGFARLHKDKGGFKRNAKLFRNSTKEAMSIFKAKPVQITGKPRQEEKKSAPFKDAVRRNLMLKEIQEKKYPFP